MWRDKAGALTEAARQLVSGGGRGDRVRKTAGCHSWDWQQNGRMEMGWGSEEGVVVGSGLTIKMMRKMKVSNDQREG